LKDECRCIFAVFFNIFWNALLTLVHLSQLACEPGAFVLWQESLLKRLKLKKLSAKGLLRVIFIMETLNPSGLLC
jgi:hypothetical protein